MINPIVSFFHGGGGIANTTKQSHITIERLYKGITTYEGWKEITATVRQALLKHGKTDPYKAAKRKLDYFMASGIWTNRKHEGKLIKRSGLIQIDIDNVRPEDMPGIKQLLIKDQHSILVFKSPSGRGFKCFIKYVANNNPPRVLVALVVGYYNVLGITIDKSTLHDKQACYACYDPEAYLNLNAKEFIEADHKALIPNDTEDKTTSTQGDIDKAESFTSNANDQHVQAFCKKVIEAETELIKDAPKGQGRYRLNMAAFNLCRYANAGISIEACKRACCQAFIDRKHTEADAIRIFEAGWKAGLEKRKQRPIIDRPY